MSARWLQVNYALALIGAIVTYGMMVEDAYQSHHWIHVVTLTPLFPYLVAAGLAYRHRRRPRMGAIIAGLTVFSAAVGWPLFWAYYMPHDTRPAIKVLIKIILPVCQGMIVILAGVAMEFSIQAQRKGSTVAQY